MFQWVVLMTVASAPTSARVAVPEFRLSGVEPTLGAIYADRLATKLAGPGVEVTTQSDLAQVLGLARQQELLGCGTEGSCLAELAGALGVDAISSGSIAKSGAGYLVTLRLLKTPDGATLSSATERVSDEAALLDFMDATAVTFRAAIVRAFGLAVAEPSSVVRWIPGIAGGALLLGGVVCLVVALTQHQALVGGRLSSRQAIDAAASTGASTELVGYTLVGLGAAGLLASILWSALAPDAPSLGVAFDGAGGAIVLTGRLP